jgi:hypothetical protein
MREMFEELFETTSSAQLKRQEKSVLDFFAEAIRAMRTGSLYPAIV